MAGKFLQAIEHNPRSIPVLLILLLLTLLAAIFWGKPHVQRDLQSRAQQAVQAAGLGSDDVSVEFNWRSAQMSSNTLGLTEMQQAAARVNNLHGVRNVTYRLQPQAAAATLPRDDAPVPQEAAVPAEEPAATPAPDPVISTAPSYRPFEEIIEAESVAKVDPVPEQRAVTFQDQLGQLFDNTGSQFAPHALHWTPAMQNSLARLLALLQANPGKRIEVAGFSEQAGDNTWRMHISSMRARGVTDYLLYNGVHPWRVLPRAYGYRPDLAGENEAARMVRVYETGGTQ